MRQRNGTAVFPKDLQFYKFCGYGFFKNLRFFDPFILLFFRETGLSFLQIGLLFSIREASVNLLEIPTGLIADTVGRRRAMLTSFSAYLLSFGFFYLWGHLFWLSAAGMVLYGLGDTFRSGTHKAMILEYLKQKGYQHLKVEYYGRTRSCSQLGSAISSLVAASLVFYYGSFRVVFLASIIPYLIDLALLYSYPKNLDGEISRHPFSFKKLKVFTKESFRQILNNLHLRNTLLCSAMGGAVFKISKDYIQPFLKKWAVALPLFLGLQANKRTALLIGLVYFVIYILTSQASRHSGTLRNKIGTSARALNGYYIANTMVYLGIGVFVWLGFYLPALLCFLGIFLIQNLQRPLMVGYVGEVTDSDRMATVLSVESQSRSLLVSMIAPLMGFLVDSFGVGGGFIGISFILLVIYPFIKIPASAHS
ncbi:MAG: MFS transporter [Calditrichia bacterium]